MKKAILLSFVAFVFSFANCNKDPMDNNGLPAASQEGKNTFGFLLNGQVWKPQGNNGTANLSVDYDAGFNKGVVGITGYRIENNIKTSIGIGIKDSLNYYQAPFSVALNSNSLYRVYFTNNFCTYFSTDLDTYATGLLTVTKLDRTSRVISGTFNAKLFKPVCADTVRITEGRFDMKY